MLPSCFRPGEATAHSCRYERFSNGWLIMMALIDRERGRCRVSYLDDDAPMSHFAVVGGVAGVVVGFAIPADTIGGHLGMAVATGAALALLGTKLWHGDDDDD